MVLAVALVAAPALRADVEPGDVITSESVDKVKDLVSPGLEWCIRHGFPITIVEPTQIDWPQAYREATERYANQVRLGADGLRMTDYVAGLPFPNIDPSDPRIAVKIMWNYDHNTFATDDIDARNFDADTGSIADPLQREVHRRGLHLLTQSLQRVQSGEFRDELGDRSSRDRVLGLRTPVDARGRLAPLAVST